MVAEARQLHVAFFPFMAHGHMIPTLDIAKLFANRGVRTTIITTPFNSTTFTKALQKGNEIELESIDIVKFRLPTEECGLPEGCENLTEAVKLGMLVQFFKVLESESIRQQLEEYLEKTRPNCLVADFFFPWATDSAAKFSIPTLVFHGISYFALCAKEIARIYEPYKDVSSDEEQIALPFLPHEVKFTRIQLPESVYDYRNAESKLKEAEIRSFGVIVNSFYELEPDYAEFYAKELGMKAWHIGPVSMCKRNMEDHEHQCLTWLKSRKPNSVIYICFGSAVHLMPPQLHEIAEALEASGQDFMWVVRDSDYKISEEWQPQGFEQRMEHKGMIIRGWAPQVLILEDEAIGAFLTHCGWNSILETVAAGVPMATFPIFAEQFYNEKLVTQILKIGVPVGAKKWNCRPYVGELVKRDSIEKAFRDIMVGEEAIQRRARLNELKKKAWEAVEEGGSSHSSLSELIDELRSHRAHNQD